jgi:hypothetical protein
MYGIAVVGHRVKNLPIMAFGFSEAAGMMMCEGRCNKMGNTLLNGCCRGSPRWFSRRRVGTFRNGPSLLAIHGLIFT